MESYYKNYHIINVFQRITPEQADALTQFWLENGAIQNPSEARRRTAEAVSLVYNQQDEIIGVCTVYIDTYTDNKPYYFGRMFIRPTDRIPGMWQFIIRDARDYLKALRIPNKPVGVLMTTENPKLMRKGAHRMLTRIGFQLISRNQRGQDILISIF